MERSVVVEYWSGVESDSGVEMLGTVLLPGITEHNTIGKIDCSFHPGNMSR